MNSRSGAVHLTRRSALGLATPQPRILQEAPQGTGGQSRTREPAPDRSPAAGAGESPGGKASLWEIETEHPGYLGAQDTFYVGTLKGVGRIYQQTFIDTYSKVAMVKLYDRKNALVAADMLNDRVLPFFEGQGVRLLRVLTDRGSEYCGNLEHHEYELFLALEDIDHSRTKAKSPQTNGICERFHRTMLDEFYRVAFRKKIYRTLDDWLIEYNEQRTHQGRWCFGKTPMQTFLDALPLSKEKLMAA